MAVGCPGIIGAGMGAMFGHVIGTEGLLTERLMILRARFVRSTT